nr:hypothetical protein [Tanacetum cinerariifolium]
WGGVGSRDGGHGNVGTGCCHGGDVVVRMAAGVVVLAVGDRRSSEKWQQCMASVGGGLDRSGDGKYF